jgi:hypothetical protein
MPFVLLTKSDLRFLRLTSVAKAFFAAFFGAISDLFASRPLNVPYTVHSLTRAVAPVFVVVFGLWVVRDRRPYQTVGLEIAALLSLVGAVVRDQPFMLQYTYFPIVSTSTAVGWSFSFLFSYALYALSLSLFGSFVQCALRREEVEGAVRIPDLHSQLLGGDAQLRTPTARNKKIVVVTFTFVVLFSFFYCLFQGLTPIWNAIPNLGPAPNFYVTGFPSTYSVSEGYRQLQQSLAATFSDGDASSSTSFVPLATMSSVGLALYTFGLSLTCLTTHVCCYRSLRGHCLPTNPGGFSLLEPRSGLLRTLRFRKQPQRKRLGVYGHLHHHLLSRVYRCLHLGIQSELATHPLHGRHLQ